MEAALVRIIWLRARSRCEYCQLHQLFDELTFQIDHAIARKHHGETIARNLVLSCFRCNSSKGSDIAGRDNLTRKLAPLFNPRRHRWARHFRWDGPYLFGLTAIGRVTIDVLKINDSDRVKFRESLIAEGLFA